MCFAPGECVASLLLESWDVSTTSECIQKCEETASCEFFNYYIGDSGVNSCKGLANCQLYSPESCTDCSVGKKTCKGK